MDNVKNDSYYAQLIIDNIKTIGTGSIPVRCWFKEKKSNKMGQVHLTSTSSYYCSEYIPTTDGSYWYYIVGVPTIW